VIAILLAVACGGEGPAPGVNAADAAAAALQSGAASPDGAAQSAPSPVSADPAPPADPTERLLAADRERGSWLMHGRTYDEQRFSPLDQIRAENVAQLVRVWRFPTGLERGHEATPLVVDGTLYFTGSWSVLFALDAKTGELRWKFDPEVPREAGAKACCDVVNRGVAYHDGRIFAGSLDGRLSALDAKTGKLLWQVVTVDQSKPYTITGAPRIVEGKVIIGNGGAELGVRGYVSAYDTRSGEQVWRTFSVPGDPSQPFESKALERAAQTWKGGEWWKIGGGGTVWDSMAYDPQLRLLYVGTGNGSPWTRHIRSPGGGDNLYLSSILALRPDSGEIVWHYQTTPGENWDFTATQHMILAELQIDGKLRKVLMQAPKNGFFYVLDRETGALISAEKYVTVTWAERVDPASGRPVEVAGQDYRDKLAFVQPTAFGGHNWQPMSFSPKSGLVYIPAQEIVGAYRLDPAFQIRSGQFNTGIDLNTFSAFTRESVSGHLLAWDPVKQREVWRQPYALPWNGGTLATAGDLVFQGTADGRFVAYRASDGEKLWETFASTGIIAAPISYAIDGTQYVSVVAGWGGAFGLAGGDAANGARTGSGGELLTFALRPAAPTAEQFETLLDRPGADFDGERLYHTYCARCHGAAAVPNGLLPDLRSMSPEVESAFSAIVLRGAYRGKGMPEFSAWLDEAAAAKILGWLRSRKPGP
jgi:quinohemoprotein ethanol dehydrogenase